MQAPMYGGPPSDAYASRPPSPLRSGALVLLILLMVFGMGVGGLMTWHHETQLYAADAQAGALVGCEESAAVNCDVVNTSAWSELFGVPIATLAIPFYAAITTLAGLALRGRDGARTLIAIAGVGAVLWSGFLYYVSTTELHYVCAWCIRLYAVNAAILVLPLLGGKLSRPAGLGPALGAFLGVALLVVGGQRAFRASLQGEGGGGSGGAELPTAGKTLKEDPKGPAPALTFTVTTEDKREATFTLEPNDAWKGNPKATVAVVEFADLECGYCKRASSEIARLYEAYGDRVLFVFKHFPMNPDCNAGVKNKKHRDACDAAIASVCAQEQGRFWAFHDLTFKNQHQLDNEYLRTYAQGVGMDMAKYDACYADNDKARLELVRADAATGTTLDIHGTPRIFINGQLYRSGSSAESMARAIELALGATAQDAAKRAAAMKETVEVTAAIPDDVPPTRKVNGIQVDTFEAAIVDGKAVSGKHNVPAIRTSWYAAKAACEAAGKRLCTEAEWVGACQGAAAVDDNGNGQFADDMIEGTAYPYGDFHTGNRCWDGKEGDRFRPVYTGEMPGCVTPTGLYDMTGNVEEWVGETPEKAVLLGGAWDTSEDHARCYRRNDTFGAGYANPRTGFRCCGN